MSGKKKGGNFFYKTFASPKYSKWNRTYSQNFVWAKDNICENPSKVIHKELATNDINTLTNIDSKLIRKTIHYAEAILLPKLFQCINVDVYNVLKTMTIKTNKDKPFLFVDNEDWNILFFFCQLKVLYLNLFIYTHKTFQNCPKQFVQIFTIHGIQNININVSLAFSLLLDKSTSSYKYLFDC